MSEHSEHAPVDARSQLRDYLAILWLRKWSVLLVTLLVVGGALAYSFRQVPLFESSARILMQSSSTPTTPGGGGGVDPVVLQTEAEILRSTEVAQRVANRLDLQEARRLLSGLSVEAQPEGQILGVHYTSPDPIQAKERAQIFAEEYLNYRLEERQEDQQAQIDVINKQITRLTNQQQKVEDELLGLAQDDPRQQALQNRMGSLTGTIAGLQSQLLTITAAPPPIVGEIIEPAALPPAPTSPNHVRTGTAALVVGLLLGIAVAFLRERLDDRLRGRADLERFLAAPVLAIVPHLASWRRKTDTPLVTATEPRSGVSEAYRTLRTSLLFTAGQRGAKTVLVTSAHAGEGKTVTAANLGVSMAQAGKRVIVLSADLRKPRVHRFFDSSIEEIGLTSILSGDVKPWEGVMDVGHENLRLVPSGPVPGNPAELLGSDAMGRLLAQFREIADFVIIDSAPVLVVADALTMAPFVDAVLLVADAEKTKRGAVVHARQQLEQVDAPVIGAVLNNFDPSKGRKAAYYYYGYYYSPYQYADGRRGRRRFGGRRQPTPSGFEPTPTAPPQDGPRGDVWSTPAAEPVRAQAAQPEPATADPAYAEPATPQSQADAGTPAPVSTPPPAPAAPAEPAQAEPPAAAVPGPAVEAASAPSAPVEPPPATPAAPIEAEPASPPTPAPAMSTEAVDEPSPAPPPQREPVEVEPELARSFEPAAPHAEAEPTEQEAATAAEPATPPEPSAAPEASPERTESPLEQAAETPQPSPQAEPEFAAPEPVQPAPEPSPPDFRQPQLEPTEHEEEPAPPPQPPQWVPTQPERTEGEGAPSAAPEWYERESAPESPAPSGVLPNEHGGPPPPGPQRIETGPEPSTVSEEAAPPPPTAYPPDEERPEQNDSAESVRRE